MSHKSTTVKIAWPNTFIILSFIGVLSVALDFQFQETTHHVFVHWIGASTDLELDRLASRIDGSCAVFQQRQVNAHIFEGWVCDDLKWTEEYNQNSSQNIQIFRYLRPMFGDISVLASGVFLPIWGLYIYSQLMGEAKPKTMIFYGFLFCLTIICTYGASLALFGSWPLPHLYNPTDYLMDFWNVAYNASNGQTYEQSGFYHPLLTFLVGLFDPIEFTNPYSLRDEHPYVSLFCGLTILVAGGLNYLTIRRNRVDVGSFFICFLSAPVIFLASRMNLLFIAYFLVSLFFYLLPRDSKTLGQYTLLLMATLPIIKLYFLLYFAMRRQAFMHMIYGSLIFVFLFYLGTLMYQLKFSGDVSEVLFFPVDILANTISFSSRFDRPFFEVMTLNYSFFSYVNPALHLLKVLNQTHLVPFVSSGLQFIKYGAFFFGVIVTMYIGHRMNERLFFLLFCALVLTFAANIGGYFACLLIPLVPELRKMFGRYTCISLALLFCPIDFTTVMGLPNFVYVNTPANVVSPHGVFEVMPIRKDISVLAILRPLALVWFWQKLIFTLFRNPEKII